MRPAVDGGTDDGAGRTLTDAATGATSERLAAVGRRIPVSEEAEMSEVPAGGVVTMDQHARVIEAMANYADDASRLRAEVERLRVFEQAFAKVPQAQQARIMQEVRGKPSGPGEATG